MKAAVRHRDDARTGAFLSTDPRHLVLAGAVALISFGQAWFRWVDWRKGFGDMAVIDQVAWLISRGKSPEISVLHWNAFGDHLAPAYLLFGGLYRIHATVAWVFLAEALAFALSVVALPQMLSALGLEDRLKTAFLIAFVCNPLMWNAVAFAGHTTTMAIPFLIIGITAATRGRAGVTALAALALLLCRDDLGLAIAAIAAIGFFNDRERRWTRWGAIAAGALLWEAIGGEIALALGVDRWWLQRFTYLGTGPIDVMTHPFHSVPALITYLLSSEPLRQLLIWLATVAFLPVLAPKRLLVVVLVALPVLAAQDGYVHSPFFHQGAVMMPFVFWAAVGGAQRWQSITGKPLHALLVPAMAICFFFLYGPIAGGNFERSQVARDDGEQAISQLAPNARLLAQSDVRERTAQREMVLVYPYGFAPDCKAVPRVNGSRNVAVWAPSEIDTIVVLQPRTETEQAQLDAVVRSPCFADLAPPEHVGDLLVYRRTGA